MKKSMLLKRSIAGLSAAAMAFSVISYTDIVFNSYQTYAVTASAVTEIEDITGKGIDLKNPPAEKTVYKAGDGTVTVIPASDGGAITVILENAAFDGARTMLTANNISDTDIVLKGSNTVKNGYNVINGWNGNTKNITFSGDGTLTVTDTERFGGPSYAGVLTFDGVKINGTFVPKTDNSTTLEVGNGIRFINGSKASFKLAYNGSEYFKNVMYNAYGGAIEIEDSTVVFDASEGGGQYVIYADDGVKVKNGSLTVKASEHYGNGTINIFDAAGKFDIDNSDVTLTGVLASGTEGGSITVSGSSEVEMTSIDTSGVINSRYSGFDLSGYNADGYEITVNSQKTSEGAEAWDGELTELGKSSSAHAYVKIAPHIHHFDIEDINAEGALKSAPTCTEPAVYYLSCKCGKVSDTDTFEYGQPNGHDWSSEWTADENYHYHVCDVCSEKGESELHTYGEWKITVAATPDSDGEKQRVCGICGYVQTAPVSYNGSSDAGKISNVTDADSNACHADVELTRDEIIKNFDLTAEELSYVENGGDIYVYLVVKDITDSVSAEDKALTEGTLAENEKVGMYIDAALFKVVNNITTQVTDLKGNVKIKFVMDEKLIAENRNFFIIRTHDGAAQRLALTNEGGGVYSFLSDKFSTYAICYAEAKQQEPVVNRYHVINNSPDAVSVDKTEAAEGETITVRVETGYDAVIISNGQEIGRISESGTFKMPAANVYIVAQRNDASAFIANSWRHSYIRSYDSDMSFITINSTKVRGVITIKLGSEYAGKNVNIYYGKKSTSKLFTSVKLDSNGQAVVEVADGMNYTAVVE